nr:hypothetical protein [uncultured Pedobacter sp.]
MNNDIIAQLKSHFDTFYKDATDNALKRFNLFKTNIENLTVEEQIIKLISEEQEVKTEEITLEKREYKELSSNIGWLFKCFTNRFLIYNVDDSENASKGIVLGLYEDKLGDLFHTLRKGLQKYTFEDFISGKEDKLFKILYKKSPTVSHQDFLKIHTWQNKYFSDLTELQRLIMVNNFRNSTDIKNYHEELRIEISLCNHIYNSSNLTPELIVQSFKKLKGLREYDFSSIDNLEFAVIFENHIKSESIPFNFLNPQTLLPLIETYTRTQSAKLLSHPALIFHSINLYRMWLETVVNDFVDYKDDLNPSYGNILSHCKENGLKNADDFIVFFNTQHGSLPEKGSAYKRILHQYSNQFRQSLNNLPHLQYYNFLYNREVLETILTQLYFVDNRPWDEYETLTLSFELDKKINFIISKLSEVYGNQTFLEDGDNTYKELIDMNYMTQELFLDSDLLVKFKQSLSEFKKNKFSERIPKHFIFKNLSESISEIFNEAINRLQEALDTSPISGKIFYIQDRLRDLRKEELNAKRKDSPIGNFHSYFKKFLDIEAEYLKQTVQSESKLTTTTLFIEEQTDNQTNSLTAQKPTKLKTKLSVPQLAYFFKALVAEDFFEFKTKKEIYDFISVNFSSKGSEDISENSIKNKYEQPKLEDVDFLHHKFINLCQTAKKDKDNL